MQIQWYPGHMTKTRRMIQEDVRMVDCVLELVDARLPLSSRNPDLDQLIGEKPRIVLLNKADLADEATNQAWKQYFDGQKTPALLINATTGMGLPQILPLLQALLAEKLQRDKAKGIVNRAIKAMVVGIPNVGKSSFINKYAKKAAAKVGDRPGVTRQKQWIRLQGLELLDTPGILWPKFEDAEAAKKLAFTGAVKDEILDVEELAHYLLAFLRDRYPDRLVERYKIENFENLEGYEITELIGKKRGFVVSGGQINTERAAITVLDEFRGGLLGRVSLEEPPK